MTETELIQAAPTPEDEKILLGLRSICADAIRELTVKVGEYVFKEFFVSEEDFASHSPTKGNRFEQFADRTRDALDQLGLSRRTLLNNARIYLVYKKMPPQVQIALDPSHYVELHRIPSPGERAEFAIKAVDEKWSVRQLRSEVDDWRRSNAKPGASSGRPRLPEVVKVVGAMAKIVRTLESVDLAGVGLKAAEREKVLLDLDEIGSAIAGLREAVSPTGQGGQVA